MQADENELTADQIAAKLNGLPKGRVPLGCQHLTMFIDVQQKLLFYAICAWAEEFSGAVLEYGAWPDPQRSYFSLRDVTRHCRRLRQERVSKGRSMRGCKHSRSASWLASGTARRSHSADRTLLIDANWGTSTDVVYQFCRQSPHAALLLPIHGRSWELRACHFADYKRRPGDRVGLNWRIPGIMGSDQSDTSLSIRTSGSRSCSPDSRWRWRTKDHSPCSVQKPEPHRCSPNT